MNPIQPPRVATALLKQFGPGSDALEGDLAEGLRSGRSQRWYWRQVVGAILAGGYREIQAHPVAVARSFVMGWIVAWGFSNYAVLVALDLDQWLFVRGFGWFYLHGYRLHLDPWMIAALCNALGGSLAVRYYQGQRSVMALVYAGTILCANIILFALWVYYIATTPPPILFLYVPIVLSSYPGPVSDVLRATTIAFGVLPAAAFIGGLWAAQTKKALQTGAHA
jgi:hypothetical protein